MRRYSKPLGRLLDFKQDFFDSNDSRLEDIEHIASLYRSQPRRLACKNCGHRLEISLSECFVALRVEYGFCSRCGHCNGAYEDTDAFCRMLYADDHNKHYAETYSAQDILQYNKRVENIYLPKARFLRDALEEERKRPVRLADFGAGAGYFVSAALECGFSDVIGYEPSQTLVDLGNTAMGGNRLVHHDLSDVVALVESSEATVASFIGVLEHVQEPRSILKALSQNDHIRYVFLLVPLFSPTVVFESVFQDIMPRHLAARHTHLYTEDSIQHFCDEFRFVRRSEWWFGLDISDLYRSISVSLQKASTANTPLRTYWKKCFVPLIDDLQSVLDKKHMCSEVHMLLEKKK